MNSKTIVDNQKQENPHGHLSSVWFFILIIISQGTTAKPTQLTQATITTSGITNCITLNNTTVLKCEGITNLTQILKLMNNSIKTLQVSQSPIRALNLSQFIGFRNLEDISVTNNPALSELQGHLPANVKILNLSSNALELIPESLFILNATQPQFTSAAQVSIAQRANPSSTTFIHEEDLIDNVETSQVDIEAAQMTLKVQQVDLTSNNIFELPKSIFTLPNLESLLLAGNRIKGDFVWEKLWEWDNHSILKDADNTSCVFEQVFRNYSLMGVLTAKLDMEETCKKVDKSKCPNCTLYGLQKDMPKDYHPISHKGNFGSIALALTLNCSNMGLKALPPIPMHAWHLDVSNNFITDLSPLKTPMYSNLVFLYLDNNTIQIETLAGAPFLDKYRHLSLRNNHISKIPLKILSSIKSLQDLDDRGIGSTAMGENYLDCNCDAWKNIKAFLTKHRTKITDSKEIYCKDFSMTDIHRNRRPKPLVDLLDYEVCDVPRISNIDREVWIYIIIGLEVVLILGVIAKVSFDQRRFRETGILPWCSKKMPRLPCDTILEGFKDRRI